MSFKEPKRLIEESRGSSDDIRRVRVASFVSLINRVPDQVANSREAINQCIEVRLLTAEVQRIVGDDGRISGRDGAPIGNTAQGRDALGNGVDLFIERRYKRIEQLM